MAFKKIRLPKQKGLNGSDVDFESVWQVLSKAFGEIHTKNASALSFEELYRHAYKLVLKKKGGDLYEKVEGFEQTWLSENVRGSMVKLLTPALTLTDGHGRTLATSAERRVAGEVFLRSLKGNWEDHQVCMGMLTDVLMYMDRVYCTDHHKPSIYARSMALFRDQVLQFPIRPQDSLPSLLHVLTHIILDQIQMDRDGENVDQHLIKANVYMLEGLYISDREVEDEKLYVSTFEQAFLRTSATFYKEEGERLLKESDAGSYCKHAKRRIDEESDRCRSTLSESTTHKIQRVVEDELIRHKMKALIEMESGVHFMVDNEKYDELGLVFHLEARVDSKKPELTTSMQKIIQEAGTNINNAATAAAQAQPAPVQTSDEQEGEKQRPVKTINQQTAAALKWVEEVLSLRDKFDTIWKTSFNSDQSIHKALERSMGDVINVFARGSEYISLFIDEYMKKGIRDKSEAEVDSTLDKAITLLRYLQDKDMFETYYKKHLCKRLLLNKSQSLDVEKQMISRMKIELGNSFTLKLEAMFKDMTLSEELTNGYRNYIKRLGDADPRRIDLGINVLTSMTWPLEAFRSANDDGKDGRTQVIFPPQIEHIKIGFERFYEEKYQGRKLTWHTNMGDADIKATFPKSNHGKPRTHDVNCSTYAMLILLLFNDVPAGKSLTVEEIQASTNIPESELKRNLQSLAVAPKTRFLSKEPMSREINAGDTFKFNENFKSQFVKIKVGVVSAGNKVENDKERKETEKKNEATRGFAVEAAIVRIMKQRKELPHAQLLTEALGQVAGQFKPDVSMIKKKIESLIEREYLERMEGAPVPSYKYLA
ncbi:hypothetical protein MBLNU230_g0955t1 [Neophaeotheca triangularis]